MNTTSTAQRWGVGMVEKDYCIAIAEGARRVRRDVRLLQRRREAAAKNFLVGTLVSWQHSRRHMIHKGVIVEVVPAGKYPNWWDGLKVRGYYREIESYVVRAEDGRHYWPITAKLQKCNAPVHS